MNFTNIYLFILISGCMGNGHKDMRKSLTDTLPRIDSKLIAHFVTFSNKALQETVS